MFTLPRQVRIIKCAILSPGLSQRASGADDRARLDQYGFDIIPFVQGIDLYESIFDNTISGTITLIENIGLPEYIPIVGVEVVVIAFAIDAKNDDGTDASRTFTHAFRITKVGDQTYPRHDYRLYTLHLATHEFVTSISSRICRAYRDVTCEGAVRDILARDLFVSNSAIITDETTNGTLNVVIPNYTPLQAINFFTTLAQTKDTPRESNFLFFETLDGFHFTSIRALIKNAPAKIKTLDIDPGMLSVAPHVKDTDAINSITRLHQEQSFDLLMDIASGTLRSKMVHFDFLARKLEFEGDSGYTESFKRTTHLDKYPVYPEGFDLSVSKNVRIFTVPSNVWTVDSPYVKRVGDELPEQRMYEAIVLRNRQLREIKHMQTLIDLPGQPDLRAGTVVNVNYPSTRHLQGNKTFMSSPVASQPTPYYSGKHIVSSVHHILASTGNGGMEYRMHIKVCRDSFGAPLIGSSAKET